VVDLDRRRVARLERTVRELERERDQLRSDLELARAWVRDLLGWIEREAPNGRPQGEPAAPGPVRRAATVTALVGTSWLLVGGGVIATLALT
jgi:hypothetical protein